MKDEEDKEEVKEDKSEKPDKKRNKLFHKKKSAFHRIGCCSLKGVSIFEIINFLMIIFTFISLSLKFLYDSVIREASTTQDVDEEFIDFSLYYLFYESLFIFDSLIIFMMALSAIKYTFFWVPSLSLITQSLQSYLNSTIKKIVTMVCILSFLIAAYCHFFYGYVTFGFKDYAFSLVRSNLLFLQGNLFNRN